MRWVEHVAHIDTLEIHTTF